MAYYRNTNSEKNYSRKKKKKKTVLNVEVKQFRET